MVSALSGRTAVLVCCLIGLAAVVAVAPSVLAGDGSEPERLTVSSFERLDSGCAEDVVTYGLGGHGNGSHERVTFLETGNASADLAAWTERTSPAGAALTSFRVHVESSGDERSNASCRAGVFYRIELTHSRRASRGYLSDLLAGDEGTRVLWLENGEYAGCSHTTEGTLDSECHRFASDRRPERTWANATSAG